MPGASDLDRMVSVTLDVDWAPDFAIRDTAELLLASDVPATWFVTHVSPAIEELRQPSDLFEILANLKGPGADS